jgi:hypothetical protein
VLTHQLGSLEKRHEMCAGVHEGAHVRHVVARIEEHVQLADQVAEGGDEALTAVERCTRRDRL